MTIEVSGTIERKGFGMGAWALVSDAETYELHSNTPKDLLQAGITAKVRGKVRQDIMTLAMIGPVLEVETYEILGG